MINGQGLGDISGLKYGLFPMSFNGCEVIAVCNALEYLNILHDVDEIRGYMERYAVLFGLFGCNIYSLGKILNHFGAECKKVKKDNNINAFIISSWTGLPFLSTIHTVFCIRQKDGRIRVYNRYNSSESCRIYKSVNEIFGGRKPLIMYKIKEEVEK